MSRILDQFKNFARTSLIGGINNSVTVFSTLANGDYNRFPDGSNGYFKLTIYNSTDYKNPSDDPFREIVWCTARTANTFTIIRPALGNNYLNEDATNTAQNHNIGGKTYSVILSLTKGTVDQIDTKLQQIDTNDANTVHLTGDQTIAGNKTFSSPITIATPTLGTHAATKDYVDAQIGGENIFDRSAGVITTHNAGDSLQIDGSIKVDTITEKTTNTGTTIGGVLIKSGLVDGVSVSGHVANASIHFTMGAISIPHTQISDFVSAVDSEVDSRITAQKGVANGIATLDGTIKVPLAQIPDITTSKVTDFTTAVNTNVNVAANTAARHTHANKANLDLINQSLATTATPTFNQVTISASPVSGSDVATKSYVDANITFKAAQIESIQTNPASLTPSIGQRFIIGTSAIGIWAGKDTQIARWNGSAWEYTGPVNGQREYILSLDLDYEFKGTWVVLAGSIDHNSTKNQQGGNSTERFHLTNAEHTIATQPASGTVPGYINTGAQTIAGLKTFTTIPQIPITDPTLASQAVSKNFLDYNVDQLNRFDKQLFSNQSGSVIPQYTVVKVTGSYGIDNLPTVAPYDGGSSTPLAITYRSMGVGVTDTLLIRGRQDITGFDTTSAPIGSRVYIYPNGTLSLIRNGFAVGITMNQQVNGYIYFDFSGIFNYLTTPINFDSLAETPSGTINGINSTFTLSKTPAVPAAVIIVLNGVMQYNGIDFTSSGATITMNFPPATGSSIFCYYTFIGGTTPGSTPWGGIVGNISDQTDLQTALNAKQNSLSGTGFIKIIGTTIGYDNSSYYLASNPNNYITLTGLSSTATGLTYNNTTGVFSLTSGYSIPTTSSQTNWDTSYTNRITSLTTTGSSGVANLSANVLNIPNYTLAGLGGQAQLSGTGFIKASGTTISYDNSSYYLASNPSNYITLASISATTPLSYNNLTGIFTIQQGNTSQSGYISNTDWNTFNGKQDSLGFTPENVVNKSTAVNLGDLTPSDTLYPSQKATKTYVDNGDLLSNNLAIAFAIAL